MLRRRILASAMASVMALGSVAIVASAEETAVKPVKTKDDLAALVGPSGTYGDAYRSNEIYDYGTKFGDLMLDTLEFADTVLEDDKATVDDYTAAYDMVVAVAKKATLYTAAELKELIDSCKSTYERDNINNEDLGDLIYTPKSFNAFVEAYEEAEAVANSSDSRIITDAYIGLEGAKKDLKELESVTKSSFTAAVKAMEKAFDKEKAYDQWRRGASSTPSVILPMTSDAQWWYYQGTTSYGELIDQLWSYTEYIYLKYNEFVEVKTASKTTIDEIVRCRNVAVAIADLINSWTPDNTNRATKASVTKLLDEYHGVMVYDFCQKDAEDLLTSIYKKVIKNPNDPKEAENFKCEVVDGLYNTSYKATTPGANGGYHYVATVIQNQRSDWSTGAEVKVDLPEKQPVSATMNVKSAVAYYIMLDDNGYARYTENADGSKTYDIKTVAPSTGKYKKVSAGVKVDLTDYIEVPMYAAAGVDDHDGNLEYDAAGNVVGGFITENKVNDSDGWGVMFKDMYVPLGSYLYLGDTAWGSMIQCTPDSELGSNNFVALQNVLPLVYKYLDADYDVNSTDADNYTIYDLDTIGQIAAGTAKRSASEWTLLYRALKYCLEDRYGTGAPCTHTRSDVEKLIEDSYDLEAETSKAAIFADRLDAMIDAREIAREWLKEAKADKKYKDNITKELGVYADDVYHFLKDKFYDPLANELAHFSISYGDVYDLIAEVEDKINEGELEETAELRAAIDAAAYALAVVVAPELNEEKSDADADLDDDPYTDDRYFLEFNRVFTSEEEFTIYVKNKKCVVMKAADHLALKAAYDALKAAAEAKPELKGDYDGNGKVDALDAAAILKDIAAAAELKAIGDYNADGVVNALDASAILKAIVAGTI